MNQTRIFRLQSSGLCHIIFWLYTNIPEEYVTSIFKVEVRRFGKLVVYIGSGVSDQEDGPIRAMGGGTEID
jgi:hypothetical protein